MKTIIVKTQAELDALPDKFDEYTTIEIRSNPALWLSVSKARGSSHVEAWGSVAVHAHSDDVIVNLFMFAVCFLLSKAKVSKKSETATIIRPTTPKGTDGWLTSQAIKPGASVILFKRVSKDYKTQEGTANETAWLAGSTLEHAAWNPTQAECSGGKYHACSRPYFCDEFRSVDGDKYIAIRISKKDLYSWPTNPQYPHKCAFRKGTVLYECDRYGKKLEVKP